MMKIREKIAGITCLSAVIFTAVSCGGPKVIYSAKVGTNAYPPVPVTEVTTFESTPQKGSYVELGEISVADELKCEVGKAFGEEKALQIIEKLRKENPDMSDLSDIDMLEQLAEKGKIERGDICDLIPRFSRKEEKKDFILVAIKGANLKLMAQKAGTMGANAVIKIKHEDWMFKGKPSSFGADATQVPALKIGVTSSATAVHYEPPEGEEAEPGSEKVLVVIKDKVAEKNEAEKEPEKEKDKEKKEKEEKAPPEGEASKEIIAKADVPKKEKSSAEEKKEPNPPEKAAKKPKSKELKKALEEVEKLEKDLADTEEGLKDKQKELKSLKADISKNKEKISSLKKEIMKKKLTAKKIKEKIKEEEEAEAKKLAALKKKDEEEKAKALAAAKEKEKKDKEAAKKEEEDKGSEEALKEAVTSTKEKIKEHKSEIFKCLRDAKMQGSVKVTFLFKPSGLIDALGFEPTAPESAHKCIMDNLKKETFTEAPRYYKAIFKYTLK